MIKILYSERFIKSARKLPKNQKEKLTDLLGIMKENPFHSKLHSKPLTGKLSGLYSFRITRDWRVVFHFLSPEEINLLEVGHRKDIYR